MTTGKAPKMFLYIYIYIYIYIFQKIEVPRGKNQSCREFDGDHLYILDIEFGRKKFFHFLTRHLEIF